MKKTDGRARNSRPRKYFLICKSIDPKKLYTPQSIALHAPLHLFPQADVEKHGEAEVRARAVQAIAVHVSRNRLAVDNQTLSKKGHIHKERYGWRILLAFPEYLFQPEEWQVLRDLQASFLCPAHTPDPAPPSRSSQAETFQSGRLSPMEPKRVGPGPDTAAATEPSRAQIKNGNPRQAQKENHAVIVTTSVLASDPNPEAVFQSDSESVGTCSGTRGHKARTAVLQFRKQQTQTNPKTSKRSMQSLGVKTASLLLAVSLSAVGLHALKTKVAQKVKPAYGRLVSNLGSVLPDLPRTTGSNVMSEGPHDKALDHIAEADFFMRTGHFLTAASMFERTLNQNPMPDAAKIKWVYCLFPTGKADRAEAMLEDLFAGQDTGLNLMVDKVHYIEDYLFFARSHWKQTVVTRENREALEFVGQALDPAHQDDRSESQIEALFFLFQIAGVNRDYNSTDVRFEKAEGLMKANDPARPQITARPIEQKTVKDTGGQEMLISSGTMPFQKRCRQ